MGDSNKRYYYMGIKGSYSIGKGRQQVHPKEKNLKKSGSNSTSFISYLPERKLKSHRGPIHPIIIEFSDLNSLIRITLCLVNNACMNLFLCYLYF